jgi:serine/threonine-protein kinase
MTQTGSIMGTAQYLSPEQAQGLAVSAPSDLYSIGIIMYEMLTGRVPFEGESAVTIALKQVGEAPVPPSAYNPDIPPALEAVILRALEKDPARRFADADEFMRALESAAAGVAPVAAGPRPASVATDVTQVVHAQPTGPMVPIPPPHPYQEQPSVEHYVWPAEPPPPLQEEPGGGSRWWIALLVGLLVAGLLVAGLLYFGKEKVQVPNVVGSPQAEAQLRLKQAGFSSDAIPHESANQPQGTVIGQDPAGGSRVKKGTTIDLFVSSGPGTAVIPDVTGQPRSVALKKLKDLGFKTTEERTTSDTIKQNHVIETRPGSGEQRDKGTTIVVVVSSGVQRVTVPQVTDLSEADARSTLTALGFQIATQSTETTDKPAGTVLAQSPAANTSVAKGSKVTLTVAKEPPSVDVPDVVGQGRLAASHTLKKAGFKVTLVQQPTGDHTQDLHVIQQDPATGQAKKGSTVTLTVGKYDPTLAAGTGGTPSSATPGTTTTP